MSSTEKPLEFVTLWSIHARQIYSYIYSLVANCNDADDAFQETSVTLIQKFSEFQPNTSFTAWACRVAYFKSLDVLKRRKRFEHLDEELLEALEADVQRSAFESEPRFEALGKCLALLPAKDRRLLNVRYKNETPVGTIARKMDRNPSSVYKSLTRIHNMLLECVRRRLGTGGPT